MRLFKITGTNYIRKVEMGDTCSKNGADVKCMLDFKRSVNRKICAHGLWRCKRAETVTSGGESVNV